MEVFGVENAKIVRKKPVILTLCEQQRALDGADSISEEAVEWGRRPSTLVSWWNNQRRLSPIATFLSARSTIGTRGLNLTEMKWRHGVVDIHGKGGMMW